MALDLETFLVALYVIVDDVYQSAIKPWMPACGGPPAPMSDAAVRCLGLAAQWRSGVPWQSARGLMRYVRKHLRHVFPTVLPQRACNRRLRRLWGAFILSQDTAADQRAQGDDDVMEGFPMPVAHGARSCNPGWWADIARIGPGGNEPLCLRRAHDDGPQSTRGGNGGALAAGHGQERWVAEWLCSTRAGVPGL